MKKTLALLSLGLALTACEDMMYAPPSVNTQRMQVREATSVEQMPVTQVTDGYLMNLAQTYKANGRGAVQLTVTYDPMSKTNTAMKAGDQAARISRTLRKNGVSDVQTSILPVREQGGESIVMINYTSYQASGPDNCGTMPGYATTDANHDPNYKMGCTVETLFAKQIANPADLLGEARPTPTTDGRRASNVVDVYRTGAPNQPLEGQTASDE